MNSIDLGTCKWLPREWVVADVCMPWNTRDPDNRIFINLLCSNLLIADQKKKA